AVVILFGMILAKGLPAFTQATLSLDVAFDPAIVKVEDKPQQSEGQSPADYRQELLAWERKVTMLNWNRVVEEAVRAAAPDTEADSRQLLSIVETNARFQLRDLFVADPSLLGKTVAVKMLASANADNWLKGNIDRSLPDAQQQLSAPARALADALREKGNIDFAFAWHIFTNTDSRPAPASAGLAGAFVGSLYMMLVVICLAVPIGVMSAVYLEEFAPKNRFTDLIEVNINNLAAVPSIVFGLLGAAV